MTEHDDRKVIKWLQNDTMMASSSIMLTMACESCRNMDNAIKNIEPGVQTGEI